MNLSKEWNKFSFQTPGSIEARLKLCFNISAALSQIHSFGSYVLVDMKPDNVIVKPDGLISIIDIDSTEILKNNTLLFPAQVATPEYTPPEYYTSIKDIEKNVIDEVIEHLKHQNPDAAKGNTDLILIHMAKRLGRNVHALLQPDGQQALIDELFACSQPEYTPSGKKVFVLVKRDALDNMLG